MRRSEHEATCSSCLFRLHCQRNWRRTRMFWLNSSNGLIANRAQTDQDLTGPDPLKSSPYIFITIDTCCAPATERTDDQRYGASLRRKVRSTLLLVEVTSETLSTSIATNAMNSDTLRLHAWLHTLAKRGDDLSESSKTDSYLIRHQSKHTLVLLQVR